MRFSSYLTALALVGLAAADDASDVVDLTPKNFDAFTKYEPLALVEFFAPWCGHCKALAPHYEEAATALKHKNIKLAKVNCVDEADLCQANGVAGYPTLKVFRKGEVSDYTGPRKADGIISYMTKQSLPAVTEIQPGKLEEFQKADKVVAVLYASSSTDAPAPEFSATANKHRDDYLFGIVTDPETIKAAGVSSTPALAVYRSFDDPKVDYPNSVASATVQEIADWLKELSVPILDEVSAENYQTYASSGKPLAYLFLDPTDAKKEEYLSTVKPVASEFKGQVNFVWIDGIKFGDHAKALNLPEPKWPAFVIQDLGKQLKFPFDQAKEVTTESVREWVKLFSEDKLEPQLKSQPVPESQEEPVYNLVGKEFEKVVFDDEKDVFVEFYATWCGHCKRLKPTWDSLGEKFQDVKDQLTIAKMEATENDLPPSVPFRVSGFPTLKFKPAGSREFLDYNGDRSLEALVAFVEENAKNSLEPKKDQNETAGGVGDAADQVVLDDVKEKHDEL